MKKYYEAKVKVTYSAFYYKKKEYYNYAKDYRILVIGESEDDIRTIISSYYDYEIAHPKRIEYRYSKEADDYVRHEFDADPEDHRAVSIDILSVKLSKVCFFWGNSAAPIYIAKLYGSSSFADRATLDNNLPLFAAFKIDVAIGAKDFREAYEIIRSNFSDMSRMLCKIFSKETIDIVGYFDNDKSKYDILSLRRSAWFSIQDNL